MTPFGILTCLVTLSAGATKSLLVGLDVWSVDITSPPLEVVSRCCGMSTHELPSTGKFATTTIILFPINISLSTAKTKLPANSTSTTEITLTAKSSTSSLIAGQIISLFVDNGIVTSPIDNGDGTYTAQYKATDTVGQTTNSAYIDNILFSTITIDLLPVISPNVSTLELSSSASVPTGEIAPVLVTLKTAEGLPITGRQVT